MITSFQTIFTATFFASYELVVISLREGNSVPWRLPGSSARAPNWTKKWSGRQSNTSVQLSIPLLHTAYRAFVFALSKPRSAPGGGIGDVATVDVEVERNTIAASLRFEDNDIPTTSLPVAHGKA